jgi:hypothetical protein
MEAEMRSDNWTRENLAWVAGVLEGEGSFLLRQGRRPEVRAAMTDEDIIRRLHEVTGVGGAYGPFKKTFNGKPVKDSWVFSVQNQGEAYALMVALYPWMGQRRREQIRKAIVGWREWATTRKWGRAGQSNFTKLTPEAIDRIRQEYDGVRFKRGQKKALAEELGVDVTTIWQIAKGKTWGGYRPASENPSS